MSRAPQGFLSLSRSPGGGPKSSGSDRRLEIPRLRSVVTLAGRTRWGGNLRGVALTLRRRHDQSRARLLSAGRARGCARARSQRLSVSRISCCFRHRIMCSLYQHVPCPRVLARRDRFSPPSFVTACARTRRFRSPRLSRPRLSPSIIRLLNNRPRFLCIHSADADESTLMRVSRDGRSSGASCRRRGDCRT